MIENKNVSNQVEQHQTFNQSQGFEKQSLFDANINQSIYSVSQIQSEQIVQTALLHQSDTVQSKANEEQSHSDANINQSISSVSQLDSAQNIQTQQPSTVSNTNQNLHIGDDIFFSHQQTQITNNQPAIQKSCVEDNTFPQIDLINSEFLLSNNTQVKCTKIKTLALHSTYKFQFSQKKILGH